MPQSPQIPPNYGFHRIVSAADGTTNPWNPGDIGVNCHSYQRALVQVIPVGAPVPTQKQFEGGTAPAGNSTPVVEVLWWSKTLNKFVPNLPAIIKTGPGAGVPFEFDLEVLGRVFAVRVNSGVTATEGVAVVVAAYQRSDLS